MFAWTDEWFTGGHLVEDWAFGLVDGDRQAKPALHEVARRCPLPINEETSVADYQRLAHAAVDEILAAERTPVVVGGTGLYLRAALARVDVAGVKRNVSIGLLDGDGSGPGVIVIQEWWGLNDWVKDQARALASQGATAISDSARKSISDAVGIATLPFLRKADAFKAGIIPAERLDDAIRRTLWSLFSSGLFDHPVDVTPTNRRPSKRASRVRSARSKAAW